MILSRRSLLTGLGATLIAAPSIVCVSSLMQVRAIKLIITGSGALQNIGRNQYQSLMDIDRVLARVRRAGFIEYMEQPHFTCFTSPEASHLIRELRAHA